MFNKSACLCVVMKDLWCNGSLNPNILRIFWWVKWWGWKGFNLGLLKNFKEIREIRKCILSLFMVTFVTYQKQTRWGEGPKEFGVLIWGGGALGMLLLTSYLRCKCRKANEEIFSFLCVLLSGLRRMILQFLIFFFQIQGR